MKKKINIFLMLMSFFFSFSLKAMENQPGRETLEKRIARMRAQGCFEGLGLQNSSKQNEIYEKVKYFLNPGKVELSVENFLLIIDGLSYYNEFNNLDLYEVLKDKLEHLYKKFLNSDNDYLLYDVLLELV